ncbi:hypothetical protein FHR81_001519 [Actinoalloteichus hoggarensis]|uniref:Uncharacterized protein n=1 Tax=Actinoalloteichus hoggarensis TaxID=1470176 RepID=A0A221W111_9PSEU|nr:hypothetical protein [Actinoalloteichus hoggarensis]ASO19251.1 hypothetical protein AHOG_08030 [Actinoalloteichus hoggarensis]MBB5920489.1 hypothetical protein [Actinoalloteichus hoggarensis]
MTTGEIVAVQRAIGEVRRCVSALRTRHGDIGPVLRMLNDVDRLSIDAADLITPPPGSGGMTEATVPRIVGVSTVPYDLEPWQDRDAGGTGGHLRRHH